MVLISRNVGGNIGVIKIRQLGPKSLLQKGGFKFRNLVQGHHMSNIIIIM